MGKRSIWTVLIWLASVGHALSSPPGDESTRDNRGAQVVSADVVSPWEPLAAEGGKLYLRGRPQEALEMFLRALHEMPTEQSIAGRGLLLYNIAQCHRRLKHDVEAKRFYGRALASNDLHDRSLVVRARQRLLEHQVRAAGRRGQPAAILSAMQQYDKLAQERPTPDLLHMAAVAAHEAGQSHAAIKYIERYIATMPIGPARVEAQRRLDALRRTGMSTTAPAVTTTSATATTTVASTSSQAPSAITDKPVNGSLSATPPIGEGAALETARREAVEPEAHHPAAAQSHLMKAQLAAPPASALEPADPAAALEPAADPLEPSDPANGPEPAAESPTTMRASLLPAGAAAVRSETAEGPAPELSSPEAAKTESPTAGSPFATEPNVAAEPTVTNPSHPPSAERDPPSQTVGGPPAGDLAAETAPGSDPLATAEPEPVPLSPVAPPTEAPPAAAGAPTRETSRMCATAGPEGAGLPRTEPLAPARPVVEPQVAELTIVQPAVGQAPTAPPSKAKLRTTMMPDPQVSWLQGAGFATAGAAVTLLAGGFLLNLGDNKTSLGSASLGLSAAMAAASALCFLLDLQLDKDTPLVAPQVGTTAVNITAYVQF